MATIKEKDTDVYNLILNYGEFSTLKKMEFCTQITQTRQIFTDFIFGNLLEKNLCLSV
ncbi:MAG: hypothetical protein FWH18_01905 [Marinilabiliaceae bacterium]|nr:hypothetical protein [Marinilabiliaceae bacterium]